MIFIQIEILKSLIGAMAFIVLNYLTPQIREADHSLQPLNLILHKKPLTSQESLLKKPENPNELTPETPNLSPHKQANAEKLAKLEREAQESEQEFLKAKEQEAKRKEALKRKLEHERGNAGNLESQTKIEVGEDIPTQILASIPKSRVRLNEREIYDLDYAIVNAKDLKPSFTTGGTQKRTAMNEEQIQSIARNFDPKKIFSKKFNFLKKPPILRCDFNSTERIVYD
ncbi:conserved hypothetical protein fragment 2 [Helicobacter acinonychis str. Sheeba]|uniref:DdrB-like domain-containing protein n=1 Tax=Helicobacter acinonychis (strain Sheeba) TaxID=382638 RepID=Q17WW7_HELAH|nr:conserved hypothetical protein fragment 2 [Helicobacter acinonychis str. Sheeba]